MAKMSLAAILGLAGAVGVSLPKPEVDFPAPKEGESTTRTAVFAGGCFWCTEAAFEQLEGVTDVVSGYCGDTKEKADYETVCSGTTNHAEAIKITYDAKKITYGELLRVLFTISEPTLKDRQGPDEGHQYRMAIFYGSDEEKKVAQSYIDQLTKAKVYDKPIQTTVEPIGLGFFQAEAYHQDYVKHHPDQPYVRAVSLPKVAKTRAAFPDEVKK
jgi:peptide-methionine (S)-S-oxide reductase